MCKLIHVVFKILKITENIRIGKFEISSLYFPEYTYTQIPSNIDKKLKFKTEKIVCVVCALWSVNDGPIKTKRYSWNSSPKVKFLFIRKISQLQGSCNLLLAWFQYVHMVVGKELMLTVVSISMHIYEIKLTQYFLPIKK